MKWLGLHFHPPAKVFKKRVVGATPDRIHPTEKPIQLYKWLLTNYAKQGDKILDTHFGSLKYWHCVPRLRI